MHPSILLLAISLIYTILIFILFSIKDKKNTLENKIYMSLLVTVIIGIILEGKAKINLLKTITASL